MLTPALFINGEVRAEGRVPSVEEINGYVEDLNAMADTPTCSVDRTNRTNHLSCAGQANVGQLTNLAALQLTEEGYGSIACASLLAIGSEGLIGQRKEC